ncbi:ICE-like protease (caspase) p20 domain protein [Ceratobasidium sp. AG-Ba]|nr:ICE-like protease (caspase) p20 domain protein [Ceratobasidium sp. AG-Ba]
MNSLASQLSGALRAGLNPAVVEAPPPNETDPLEFVEEAVLNGDRLKTDTEAEVPPRASRRALIVAPQYLVHVRQWSPLEHTMKDVVMIYNMLLDNGYAKHNIRILVDGLEDMEGVQPTRDNIVRSLEWLVSGARKSDYRYFHFSGHGALLDSEEGEGKQAFEVPEHGHFKAGDHDLDPSSNNHTQYNRVEIVSPGGRPIRYYKEAIVASFKPVKRRGNKPEYYVVYDTELNKTFSKLPEGCRLTCTLDCCHSGRMIGCNFKLDGAGFRSRKCFASDEGGWAGKYSLGPAQRSDPDELQNLAPEPRTRFVPLEKSLIPRAKSTLSVFVGALPKVVLATPMTEALPPEEIAMDQIKADMLVWSACHQRQLAYDYKGGLFTKEFTSLAKASRVAKMTVGGFHHELNLAVKNAAATQEKDHFIQYAQVEAMVLKRSVPIRSMVDQLLQLRLPSPQLAKLERHFDI